MNKPIAAILLLLPWLLLAQTPSQPGEPIDFMTIVIEGKEALNLPKSLLKLPPSPPARYDSATLDSINPLEKVPLFRSNPPEQPLHILQPPAEHATIAASAGLYGFATLDAHYQTILAHYTLDLYGVLDRGGAYITNADYFRTRFHVALRSASEHEARTNYSLSSAELTFDRTSYQLFALPVAPQRSLRSIALSLNQTGTLDNRRFTAGLTIANTHLTQSDSLSTDESELRGKLTLNVLTIENVQLDAIADLSYRNYRSLPLHFHTVGVSGHRADSSLAIEATLAAQFATTSRRSTDFAPYAAVGIKARATSFIWLDASLSTGMEAIRFADLTTECPYLSDTAAIGTRTFLYRLQLGALYTPAESFMLALRADVGAYSTAPFFESLSDGTVAPLYGQQHLRSVELSSIYRTEHSDRIAATVQLRDVRFDDGTRVPYQPLLRATVEYGRVFVERLSATIQAGYVTERRSARTDTTQIGGYFLLGARAEYQLTPSIALSATLDNLFGTTYERWRQYRERGSFVAIGAVVRL